MAVIATVVVMGCSAKLLEEAETDEETGLGETTDEGADFIGLDDTLAPDLGPADSYLRDMQPIWLSNCVSHCHGPGGEEGPAGGLDLAENSYEGVVGIPSMQSPLLLIAPGDPDASYLWHKLNDTHLEVGGEGEPMPFATELLDADTRSRVETWILGGALP